MTNEAWIENLKIGDVVFVSRNSGYLPEKDRVARITPTQIVLNHESKFRKDSGHSVGTTTWNHRMLLEPTPERIAEHKREQVSHKVLNLIRNFAITSKVSDDSLNQIAALFESLEEKKEVVA